MKNWIRNITKKIYSPSDKSYLEVDDIDYYLSFGVTQENGGWVIKEKGKIEAAYSRAWENRDFEINKFWTRAAYFWGFIVLIFGAYFRTSQDKGNIFIQLIIICLGIIFSIAWYYVILGSKRWQENWELHIDKLEDFITGPLYKTIFHKGTFYSVSKINEILSLSIIIVWLALLWKFLYLNNSFPWQDSVSDSIDFQTIIILSITIFFSMSIICGYSRKKYSNEKDRFIKRKPRA